MPKFLANLNLNKSELQNAVIQNLATAPSSPSVGQFYYDTILGHLYVFNGSAFEQASGASGSGSVTSVAMTVPSILSVAGSPVTTSGTIAVSLANQAANTVLAGAASGGAATPAFRALVAADV